MFGPVPLRLPRNVCLVVYLKIGQSVRYLKADLDAWMLADARISTSDTSSKAA
jgi:hypothetical protein